MKARLEGRIAQAKESDAYRNYLDVRDHVWAMMDEMEKRGAAASDYWEEELEGFDYMLDASPLIVAKLREHCYHLTGLRSYEYRDHHGHKGKPFRRKLKKLREADRSDLFVPESPELGGYGHKVGDDLINLDTLKFYESLIALDHGGVLGPLRENREQKNLVIEIGAGWGGFGYQFKTLAPNTTYMIVDLPQTILFSATYLRTLFPDAKTLMWSADTANEITANATDYDFVFVPHFAFPTLELPTIDLAINMVSFQEMTTEQVDGYLSRLEQLGCKTLYSHNRDRSAYNPQLTAVSELVKSHFAVTEVGVLEIQYTDLKFPEEQRLSWAGLRNPKQMLRACLQTTQKATGARSQLYYRHLIGRPARKAAGVS